MSRAGARVVISSSPMPAGGEAARSARRPAPGGAGQASRLFSGLPKLPSRLASREFGERRQVAPGEIAP